MKLLFSATSAFGHILPLVPLMQAAVDAGHGVGLLSSAGFRATVGEELPAGVEFLDAGVMPDEFSEQAARRTGADVFHPTPAIIGEIFGGARVDLGIEDSIEQATGWAADLVSPSRSMRSARSSPPGSASAGIGPVSARHCRQ
jgi:hypothetical protein